MKRAQLTGLKQREGNPNAVAQLAFARRLYGERHPFGTPSGGTVETVEGITLDDLRGWYGRNMSASVAAFGC